MITYSPQASYPDADGCSAVALHPSGPGSLSHAGPLTFSPSGEPRPVARCGRALRLLIGLAPLLLLAACAQAPSSVPEIIVVAASATMNEPAPVLAPSDSSLLYQSGAASTMAVAYVVDPSTGQPTEVPLTPLRPDGQVEYGPNRPYLLRENVRQVQRVLDHEAARGPFDLLNIIAAATRIAPPPATLILLSSGLSTAGGLDIRQVGWDTDPASVAAQLKARDLLPSLAGYHVVFSGLADTFGRQPALPLPLRTTLTAYWLAICQASGAASCSTDDLTRPDPPSRSTTPVPVVPVPAVRSVHGRGGTTTTLPDALLFQFNSAALLPTADSILQPIATQARRQHLQVSITGHASPDGGTASYNTALSKRRAITVRNDLVALGLPAAQIIKVTGVGTAGQPPDACLVQGQRDEAVCAKLRSVVILLDPLPRSITDRPPAPGEIR